MANPILVSLFNWGMLKGSGVVAQSLGLVGLGLFLATGRPFTTNSSLQFLILTAATQQAPASVTQRSDGWCSPNIANVVGNVTVNCIGVDPGAMQFLNVELNKKNLQLDDKISEANRWAARYKELEARLAQSIDDTDLSRKAEKYLHEGKLDKAGELLDRILPKERSHTEQYAANELNRALIFELKFQMQYALPHLEAAYKHSDGKAELDSGMALEEALQNENNDHDAEPVLLNVNQKARDLAKESPAIYLPYVADSWLDLAILYSQTQRLTEAENACQEALRTYRNLAEDNPAAYQLSISSALNGLATIYDYTDRPTNAEKAYGDSADILAELAKTNSTASRQEDYLRQQGLILENLAGLYMETQRMKDAEDAHLKALRIRRDLAKGNSPVYRHEVAITLGGLAVIYKFTARPAEAENAWKEAVEIMHDLAKTNRPTYLPDEALYRQALGEFYSDTGRAIDADEALKGALVIRRELARLDPARNRPYLAETLNSIATRYMQSHRPTEAECAYKESYDIWQDLAKSDSAEYMPKEAQSLNNLALLYLNWNDLQKAKTELDKALEINRRLWNDHPERAGDGLARSLLIDVEVLVREQNGEGGLCSLAREASRVGNDQRIKAKASEEIAAYCPAP